MRLLPVRDIMSRTCSLSGFGRGRRSLSIDPVVRLRAANTKSELVSTSVDLTLMYQQGPKNRGRSHCPPFQGWVVRTTSRTFKHSATNATEARAIGTTRGSEGRHFNQTRLHSLGSLTRDYAEKDAKLVTICPAPQSGDSWSIPGASRGHVTTPSIRLVEWFD